MLYEINDGEVFHLCTNTHRIYSSAVRSFEYGHLLSAEVCTLPIVAHQIASRVCECAACVCVNVYLRLSFEIPTYGTSERRILDKVNLPSTPQR